MAATHNPKYKDVRGKMFTLDLTKNTTVPAEMSIVGDVDLEAFNPHGISLHTHKGSIRWVLQHE